MQSWNPTAGEIDWEAFSFQSGFRQNRVLLPGLPLPDNTLLGVSKKSEAGSILGLPSKPAMPKQVILNIQCNPIQSNLASFGHTLYQL